MGGLLIGSLVALLLMMGICWCLPYLGSPGGSARKAKGAIEQPLIES
jgi:hypothetical protein